MAGLVARMGDAKTNLFRKYVPQQAFRSTDPSIFPTASVAKEDKRTPLPINPATVGSSTLLQRTMNRKPSTIHESGGLALAVKRLAAEVGYVACGVTTAAPFVEFEVAVRDRMARFAEAACLYEGMLKRADPRGGAPWVNSIIVCVRRYGEYAIPEGLAGRIGRNYLFDRRNEKSRDHEMPKKMTDGLKALGLRVKKGGAPDRWAAARAGVARVARNCFAFSECGGSWINIATWRVDAELPGDEPTLDVPCPEGCRKCVDACPTGALMEPFVMRMDHCVAHLTFNATLPIDPDLWKKMGCWIYGCDRCQEVCPLNEGKWTCEKRADWLEELAPYLTPRALAEMSEETYRTVVHPAFWYIPEDGVERWRANARRAGGRGSG